MLLKRRHGVGQGHSRLGRFSASHYQSAPRSHCRSTPALYPSFHNPCREFACVPSPRVGDEGAEPEGVGVDSDLKGEDASEEDVQHPQGLLSMEDRASKGERKVENDRATERIWGGED